MPHLDRDKWKHFILHISSPSGDGCDPLFLCLSYFISSVSLMNCSYVLYNKFHVMRKQTCDCKFTYCLEQTMVDLLSRLQNSNTDILLD